MNLIETERLVLRAFQKSDAKDVYEYTNAQTVTCFLDMRYNTLDETEEVLKNSKFNGVYSFAIMHKDSKKVIGEILSFPEAMAHDGETPRTYSTQWMLHPDYQGLGYGFEATKAYFDYMFHTKNARRIYACVEDGNYPSQNLCKKLGMRYEGTFIEYISFVNNPDGTPLYENTMQFAILKKEWRF